MRRWISLLSVALLIACTRPLGGSDAGSDGSVATPDAWSFDAPDVEETLDAGEPDATADAAPPWDAADRLDGTPLDDAGILDAGSTMPDAAVAPDATAPDAGCGMRAEVCDGVADDDCDGRIDEGCAPCSPAWTTTPLAVAARGGTSSDRSFAMDMTLRPDGSAFLLYINTRTAELIARYRPVGTEWDLGSSGLAVSGSVSPPVALAMDPNLGGVHYLYRHGSSLWHAWFPHDGGIPEGAVRWFDYGGARLAVNTVSGSLEIGALSSPPAWGAIDLDMFSWSLGETSPELPTTLVSVSARGFDIGVDASGAVHVVHTVFSSPEHYSLRHSVRPLDSWTWTTTTIGEGQMQSLLIAADGTIHILFLEPDYGFGHGWLPPGGAWNFETIAPMPHGWGATMAMDPDGGLHVAAVRHYPNWDLVHWYRSPSGLWSSTVIDASGLIDVNRARIAVAGDGTVMIAYASMSTGEVRWAERSACP